MIIISPPIRRAAMAELRAIYLSAMDSSPGSPYYVPDSVVRKEYQSPDGYLTYKLAGRLKNSTNQAWIVREEKNIAQ
jgi:hypothetical protein